MSNLQQCLNADQTKGQTQVRREEWLEGTKETTHERRDTFPSDPAQPQQQGHATFPQQAKTEVSHERRDIFPSDPAQPAPSAQPEPTFLQQTGEKVAHAMESVKETLGMGDKK